MADFEVIRLLISFGIIAMIASALIRNHLFSWVPISLGVSSLGLAYFSIGRYCPQIWTLVPMGISVVALFCFFMVLVREDDFAILFTVFAPGLIGFALYEVSKTCSIEVLRRVYIDCFALSLIAALSPVVVWIINKVYARGR